MRISEPMTVFTDCVLAVLAAALFWQLLKLQGESGRQDLGFWAGSFMWTALAALTGAARHGLSHGLDELGNSLLLKATLIFLGLAAFNLIEAAARSGLTYPRLGIILAANAVVFLGYIIAVTSLPRYAFIAVYYGIALLLLLIIHIGNGYLVASAVISVVASLLWLAKVSPDPSFNHSDLYHVLQLPALWLLYQGSRSLP